jgi:hypothetical protein
MGNPFEMSAFHVEKSGQVKTYRHCRNVEKHSYHSNWKPWLRIQDLYNSGIRLLRSLVNHFQAPPIMNYSTVFSKFDLIAQKSLDSLNNASLFVIISHLSREHSISSIYTQITKIPSSENRVRPNGDDAERLMITPMANTLWVKRRHTGLRGADVPVVHAVFTETPEYESSAISGDSDDNQTPGGCEAVLHVPFAKCGGSGTLPRSPNSANVWLSGTNLNVQNLRK